MAKAQTLFSCTTCGAIHKKWNGKCDACGEWNTLIEDNSAATTFSKITKLKSGSVTSKVEFFEIEGHANIEDRHATGFSELDRVFGGGIVEASATLIGGDPGIGKSTILLQLANNLAASGKSVAYITGEESVDQVRLRARRLNANSPNIMLASATNVSEIITSLKQQKPQIVVIDSIQTMFVDSVESAPGTVSQVRISAHELINYAKHNNCALILVGHVTKDGQIAGPKVLEHMVDTVLYFEGDSGNQFRILRAVKNRFGAANEIGVFEMMETGLEEVTNPSAMFISGKAGQVSGSVIFAGIEGTRPVLLEIQALVSQSPLANPRRAVVGWDLNRLAMILAVLQTRCGFKLFDKEVYLNVTGGIKINEPAADLAVAAAIVSALSNIPMAENTVIFGEVGLSGEIRPVSQTEARIKEAERLGFKCAIVSGVKSKTSGSKNIAKDSKTTSTNDFNLREIKYLRELADLL
jgi:DNA repair protein RadA/Sms